MTGRSARPALARAALVGTLVGIGGCAYEDSRGEARSAERSVEEVDEPATAAKADAPAPPADEAPPLSFAEIERELADNNAKLRTLGVRFEHDGGDGEFAAEPEPKPIDKAGKGGGAAPRPDPAPSQVSPGGTKQTSTVSDKKSRNQPRRDKGKEAEDFDDQTAPEPAKATPLTPNGLAPNLDAATRCQQICDLSEISCSLGDQICELSARHPEQADYGLACERAVSDCDAAKEACDECTE